MPNEIRDAVREYIISNGHNTKFPDDMFRRVKIAFFQYPKELIYKGKRYPLTHLEAGDSRFSDIPSEIWARYLRTAGLKYIFTLFTILWSVIR